MSESQPSPQVDIAQYASPLSTGNKVGRLLWGMVWIFLFRPSPRFCFAWRNLLLRLFGAKLGRSVHIYSSCRIWAPWNLSMGDHSSMAEFVDCYCVAKISIGDHATVSQYSHLCAASHEVNDARMRLVTAPITIGNQAWVCAGAFVGPGRTLHEGAVAGARAVITRDVEAWTVVAGNPAKEIRKRDITAADS